MQRQRQRTLTYTHDFCRSGAVLQFSIAVAALVAGPSLIRLLCQGVCVGAWVPEEGALHRGHCVNELVCAVMGMVAHLVQSPLTRLPS